MSVNRKRRRADGKVRPSIRRYRLRKRSDGQPFIDPADGDKFHSLALHGTHVWAGTDLQQATDLDPVTLGRILEQAAEPARWLKLRDTAGVVRAIAMPRNHPDRNAAPRHEHRREMLDHVSRLAHHSAIVVPNGEVSDRSG